MLFATSERDAAHWSHRMPFEEARVRLFNLIFDLLGGEDGGWSADSTRSFVGYAPVLEALAEYLHVENYKSLVNELDNTRSALAEAGGVSLWRFLLQVVRRILEREQSKIGGNVRGALQQVAGAAGWSRWDDLYRPEEQCARVLARRVLNAKMPQLPDGLPTELRGPYEAALEGSVLQHPFVGDNDQGFANVVFQEYLYAWGLTSGSHQQQAQVRQLLSAEYLPSPLLARFILTLAGAGAQPTVDSEDFGILYESLRSQGRTQSDVFLALTSDENADTIGHVSNARESAPEVTFRLRKSGPRARVMFLRRLSNAGVAINGDVDLGMDRTAFLLGPDVDLECETLRVPAASVRVQTLRDEHQPDAADVVLVAAAHEASGALPQLTVQGSGIFGVRWPHLAYPWIAYQLHPGEISSSEGDEWEIMEAARALNRILRWFRSRGYGGLTRHSDLIERFAVGNDPLAQDLRDFMFDRGVLERGALYSLNADRMGDFGINWADIRNRNVSPNLRAFLTDFVQHRSQRPSN